MIRAFLGLCVTKMGSLGLYLKREYQKSCFKKIGKGTYIGKNCIFTPKNIEIGDDTYIGPNCVFQSSYGTIQIGSHVMFGPGVHIHGGNHRFNEIGRYIKDASLKRQGDDGKIVIEEDCWIGANAIILSNVTIGKGTVIGAGSIVTKDVPQYSIYTGAPACKVRERFSKNDLERHIRQLENYEENTQ